MKRQKIYLEHANITVVDLHKSIRFFQTAFPHFEIRGGGKSPREWVHIGDDTTYLAINQVEIIQKPREKDYRKLGVNHIGFVVEDLSSISKSLKSAGFKRSYPKQIEKFRIRDYFYDPDGNEVEFVQYLSENIEERNSYKLADSAQ